MANSNRQTWADQLEKARAIAALGQPVIGYAGGPFPLELAEAAGIHALRIDACPSRQSDAIQAWIDDKEDPRITAMFAAAMDGEFDFLSALIITRRYDYLHYFLREVLRQGAAPNLPPLHLFDLVPIAHEAIERYDRGAFARLVELLERIGGPVDWNRAAEVRGIRQKALQQIIADQITGAISGTAAIQARLAGCSLSAADFAALAVPSPEAGSRRLLLIASEPFTSDALHAAIEAEGWHVARDDDGSGQVTPFLGDKDARDLKAIAALYVHHLPSTLADPREARHRATLDCIATGKVDAALFVVDPADNRLGWDFPPLRNAFAEAGVPSALVRLRPDDPDLKSRLRDALSELTVPA